jgi:hypothetical protein
MKQFKLQLLFLLTLALQPEVIQAVDRKSCTTIMMVAPVSTSDALQSADLTEIVRRAVAKQYLPGCPGLRLVAQEDARIFFDYVGMSAFFSRPMERLSTWQVEFLRQETGATRFASGVWNKARRSIDVTVWNITRNSRLNVAGTFTIELGASEVGAVRSSPWILNELAWLTPNSFTIGFGQTSVYAFDSRKIPAEWKESGTSVYSKLPQIISSIGFNKIDYPTTFDGIDLTGSLFPGTYFFAIDQETSFVRTPDPKTGGYTASRPFDTRTIAVEIYGACTNAMALGNMHTVLGTTYAGLGIGPCIHWRKEDNGQGIWTIDLGYRGLLGQRVFVAKNSYIFFESDFMVFTKDVYDSEVGKSNQLGRGILGWGTYVPDVEHQYTTFVRDVFGLD